MDKYQVKATFFVVGEWVDKYSESVKALHDAGHEVMNHSNTHAHYPQLSADQVVADLNACNDKIEGVTGVRPTLVRLPYGDYDDNSINAVRSIGMEPIQWGVELLETAETHWGARDSAIESSHDKSKNQACNRYKPPEYPLILHGPKSPESLTRGQILYKKAPFHL